MTLTCNTIQDLLPLWADDVLHPGSREEIEAHLAACPACRKKAEALRPQTQETSLPPRLGGNDGSASGWHWPCCWPSAC